MKIIKLIIGTLLAGGLTTSCIERYFPEYETNFMPKLVIEGTVIPGEGEQEIVVSLSSSPNDPKFIPVSECGVWVEDDKGNRFLFNESQDKGHYLGRIEDSKVIVGAKYRLSVATPENKLYRSSYEQLLPCPPIDSVYTELEFKPTADPKITKNGIQFFIDFKGNDNDGHFYRWELIETYEYHSRWPLDKYLDENGHYHDLVLPDFSNFVCYKTVKLGNIFVLSTEGLSTNNYSNYKLHFVPDHTLQLEYKYSLLVNQYSINKKAYVYWENLRKNNQETTDLFGKQPARVKGNISNMKDSTDIALGYFGISSVQSKRIMVLPVKGLEFSVRCKAIVPDGPVDDRPLYFAIDYDASGEQYTGIAAPECIFCPLMGGTTEKPSYWDQK